MLPGLALRKQLTRLKCRLWLWKSSQSCMYCQYEISDIFGRVDQIPELTQLRQLHCNDRFSCAKVFINLNWIGGQG
ncbi:hypothetical protein PsexTeo8_30030 [Pseudomonas extremaustralis]|nr:hypothetical protein [Pseudomonas extremaustralis]